MKDIIRIAATADWHIGHPNPDGEYPSPLEIVNSLQNALNLGVDAYIIAGDIINKGSKTHARYAVSLIQPFIEKGLRVIAIDGNHDFDKTDGTSAADIFSSSGVIMLEGQTYTISKPSGKSVAIVGVSGELDETYNGWLHNPDLRKQVVDAAAINRRVLAKQLDAVTAENIVVVTHRGIIPDTVGTAAKEGKPISPHIEGFADIIDRHAAGRNVVVVHGHNHGTYPWEGFPEGVTAGGVRVSNVAAPVRRREGLPLAKLFTF